MTILIPEEIKSILEKLNNNGFEAYVVGGCVRDSILGNTPKDWDICTAALPEETMKIFNDYDIIETGLKHGTITLMGENDSYEITTFRIDGEYSDGRHPDEVSFTTNLKEDLSRRDLTINSLAADKNGNIIDYFNGLKDIENKIIRCVGNPINRYNEDALRILRTLRFASIFNFSINENTKNAIKSLYVNLNNVSQERISSEFVKLLKGKNCTNILREYSEVFFFIIPELKDMFNFNQNNPNHQFDVWEHTLKVLENIENKNDINLMISGLFHDIGKPSTYSVDKNGIGHFYNHFQISGTMTENILKRMRFSNETIKEVSTLVFLHDREIVPSKRSILKLLNQINKDMFNKLLLLKKADTLAKKENNFSDPKLEKINEISIMLNSFDLQKECFSLKALKINGKDLINLGLAPGEEFKIILNEILMLVIEDKIPNEKEKLLEYISKKYL